MSAALALTLAAALGSLTPIFTEPSWWFSGFGTIVIVTFAIAATRALTRGWLWGTLAGLVVLVISLTFSFAAAQALLGFIPTLEVFEQWVSLVISGADSISGQSVPADPVTGIVFMLTGGAGVLALVVDVIAFRLRRPALTGLAFVGLLAVPTIFDPAQADPFFFFVTAAGYLFILYLSLGEPRSAGALGVGAIAVAVALLIPVLVPAGLPDDPDAAPGRGGFTVGINTFVSLGENLRRPNIAKVLTYVTESEGGQYLTVSSIDNFEGDRWVPSPPIDRESETLDEIGPIPGLGDGIDIFTGTTSIKITNMGGRFAPVPYAPTSILGLDGSWSYDPENLTVTSVDSTIRGAAYDVTGVQALPSQQQLRAAGTDVSEELLKYLEVPTDLPSTVYDTAQAVAGTQATNFDKAIALQSYFTGGEFEYSERAPVMEGYDGTSAEVIGRFLEEKKGYCVHFSGAMAVMARTLGIPARISVGFTPGELVVPEGDEAPYYSVSTANLHAWPELYFNNIGWVRFEPTVGRGALPDFPESVDTPEDPNTPAPTSSAAPTNTAPTATPTPTSGPVDAGDSTSANLTIAAITVLALGLAAVVVLLLPLLPMVIRTIRRARRYWRVWRRHSAADAWREISDTAIDLGWKAGATTPREFEDLVRTGMGAPAQEALERLRAAIEATAYSPRPAPAQVADIREVRRGMVQASARADRWRARFAPASAPLRRPRATGVS